MTEENLSTGILPHSRPRKNSVHTFVDRVRNHVSVLQCSSSFLDRLYYERNELQRKVIAAKVSIFLAQGDQASLHDIGDPVQLPSYSSASTERHPTAPALVAMPELPKFNAF